MTTTHPPQGIQELILNKKRDRSMESLSKACGGNPSRANLQRLATEPVKAFPKDIDTIRGLARGLGVRVIDIIVAFSVSLGLPVNTDDQTNLTLEGAGKLPDPSKDLLRAMADQMLSWQEQANMVPRDPDDAANYDLAAHPPFETDRDRFNKEHGDAGEENQDTP